MSGLLRAVWQEHRLREYLRLRAGDGNTGARGKGRVRTRQISVGLGGEREWMANQVDSLDEQILAALQENGRLTMKSLAEQVGLSSPAMIERVRRLEERGVISGYRAIVAPAALGRPISALIAATVDRRDHEAFNGQVRRAGGGRRGASHDGRCDPSGESQRAGYGDAGEDRRRPE